MGRFDRPDKSSSYRMFCCKLDKSSSYKYIVAAEFTLLAVKHVALELALRLRRIERGG